MGLWDASRFFTAAWIERLAMISLMLWGLQDLAMDKVERGLKLLKSPDWMIVPVNERRLMYAAFDNTVVPQYSRESSVRMENLLTTSDNRTSCPYESRNIVTESFSRFD